MNKIIFITSSAHEEEILAHRNVLDPEIVFEFIPACKGTLFTNFPNAIKKKPICMVLYKTNLLTVREILSMASQEVPRIPFVYGDIDDVERIQRDDILSQLNLFRIPYFQNELLLFEYLRKNTTPIISG